MVNGCLAFITMSELLFFSPERCKVVCTLEQTTSQTYQTDLEAILEFLEEHYRQEARGQWETGEYYKKKTDFIEITIRSKVCVNEA